MTDASETGDGAQREGTSDDDGPTAGGPPDEVSPIPGKCADCGSVYLLQVGADGELRPTGTEGGCDCGSTEFRRLATE